MRRGLVALALMAGCRGGAEQADLPQSDEAMLAAREQVAARLLDLFRAGERYYAADPEGSGSATMSDWAMSAPDPRPFAAAPADPLPRATQRLTACRDESEAARVAFRRLTGPYLGEGSMAGGGMSKTETYAEVSRQIAAATAAYCAWRDATRTCRTAATAAGLPPPVEFEPPHLACGAAMSDRETSH